MNRFKQNENIEVLKTLFLKKNRELYLVKINNVQGILKKFEVENKKQLKQFNYEKNVLLNNNWNFVPKILDHGEDYFICEYIDSKSNIPEDFEKYMDQEYIDQLVEKLVIINQSEPIKELEKREWLMLSIMKLLYGVYPGGISFKMAFKTCYLLVKYWILSYTCFNYNVRTKGDFTELNVLIKKGVYFIDFAAFFNRGFLLEDATYMALHQDKLMHELNWQKLFLSTYYKKIKIEYKRVNKAYISFWLIYSSLMQLKVRYYQNVKTEFENEDFKRQLIIKKQHFDFFLSEKKRSDYVDSIIS